MHRWILPGPFDVHCQSSSPILVLVELELGQIKFGSSIKQIFPIVIVNGRFERKKCPLVMPEFLGW